MLNNLKEILKQIWQILLLLALTPTFVAAHTEVVLQPIHGQPISFSSLKGRWVFINYWASWCEPCLNEIPELNRFFSHTKPETMALFSVNYDMLPINAQKQLIQEHHILYPGLKTDPAESLHLGDIRGIPVTFVFNPEGRLVHTLYGEQTAEALRALMN